MQVTCPVCHMQVPAGQLALVFQGRHFAFCSEQCRERFQATPHLYIGVPGHKAAKQVGQEVIKRRCFRLDEPLSDEQRQVLKDAVSGMMGIKEVVVEDAAGTGGRFQCQLLPFRDAPTGKGFPKPFEHTPHGGHSAG